MEYLLNHLKTYFAFCLINLWVLLVAVRIVYFAAVIKKDPIKAINPLNIFQRQVKLFSKQREQVEKENMS